MKDGWTSVNNMFLVYLMSVRILILIVIRLLKPIRIYELLTGRIINKKVIHLNTIAFAKKSNCTRFN